MADKLSSRGRTQKGWTALSVLLVAALLLSGCSGGRSSKVYHVGVLSGLDYIADVTDGFKAKMSQLGYIEGQNIVYDVQRTNFDMEAYQRIVGQFIADQVDLILVFPTEASIVVRTATEGTDIPVVFTYAITEGMGLVDDLRNPGGNVTGVRYPNADIALKRLEMLLEIAPQVKRIYMPYQRGYPIVPAQLEAQPAGGGFDAVLMLIEPLLVGPDAYQAIASYAYEHDIPIGGTYVAAGELKTIFGAGVNSYDAGMLAAPLADKILQGTPAGTIPVVSSEVYIDIDISTAQHFGLIVPEGLLMHANRIIR
jgi:putative ABC transport system substrate-binding protein